MKIPWREKFGLVVSLCFTGNKDRVPELDHELARVGLPVDVRMWNVPSPFEDVVVAKLPRVVPGMRLSAGFRNSGFGHYRAVKLALQLGVERVLVIEDDVRFMRDLDRLAAVVENAPGGVALFDLLRAGKDDVDSIRKALDSSADGGWAVPGPRPCSLACYSMDRPAMDRFARIVELALSGVVPMNIVDHFIHARYWMSPLLPGPVPDIHVAWPLACVQKTIPASMSNTHKVFHGGNSSGQYQWYSSLGVDLSLYALDSCTAS